MLPDVVSVESGAGRQQLWLLHEALCCPSTATVSTCVRGGASLGSGRTGWARRASRSGLGRRVFLLRQVAPSPACIFQRFLDVSLPLFPLNFRGGSAVLRSRGGPRVWPSSLSGWKPVHSVSWGRGERLAGRGESPGCTATAGLGLRPPEPFLPTPCWRRGPCSGAPAHPPLHAV